MTTNFDQSKLHEAIISAPPWYRNSNLMQLYLLLIAPMLTSTAWGFDLSMTNGLQSVETFMNNFGNPQGATLGFYGASTSVGGIVACLIGSTLSDRFGRRPLCFVGSILVIGMALMESWSTNFGMFTGGKLLLGLGGNLQQLGGPVLVTELAHPKQRSTITAIYNTSIFIGLIIGAWITFGTYSLNSQWAWRIPCLIQVALPTYQAAMIWFCPESPRWLVSKGRINEARSILIKYHGNGVEDDIVKSELAEIIAGIESDKTQLKFNIEDIKTVLGSKGNRHRLWICFWCAVGSQCAGQSLISSYLPQILNQVGLTTSKQKTLIYGIQSICNWVVALAAAFVIPRFSRRKLFLTSILGMLASFIVWTALAATYLRSLNKSYGIGVVVIIFIFNAFCSMCWIPMVVAYPLETVTTKQRGIFFAWTLFTINASAFIASYINPIALQDISWHYYIIQVVFDACLAVIIYFTFVETNGLTLEEIAVLFDDAEDFTNAMNAVNAAMDAKTDESNAHVEEVRNEKV